MVILKKGGLDMSSNALKKMMVFSSIRNRVIAETMLSDESDMNNSSISSLMESHLLNDLLPQNQNASIWIKNLYANEWSIGRILQASFDYMGAGINWKAKFTNGLPIVKYAHKWECIAHNIPDNKAPEMHHFLSQFKSLVDKLEQDAEVSESFHKKNDAKYSKELYEIAVNEFEFLRFSNVYQLIIDQWDSLSDWQITYRLLGDLASMQTAWTDSAESRTELVQILKDVSKDWK